MATCLFVFVVVSDIEGEILTEKSRGSLEYQMSLWQNIHIARIVG